MFSRFAENPIPGGPNFQDVVPNGNITDYVDRWKWVKTDPTQAMFDLWNAKTQAQQLQLSSKPIREHAADYAWLPIRPIFD